MDAVSQAHQCIEQAVGLLGQAQLLIEGVEATPPTAAPVAEAKPVPTTPLPKMAWGKKVSPEFKAAVFWIKDQIKLNPDFLMSCSAFETGGTFSPSIKNPVSSATGLIQFMDGTVQSMLQHYPQLAAMAPNRKAHDLASLTAVQQLSWVYYYFKGFGNDLSSWSLEDTYMAILLPNMIGKPLDSPMNWNASAYRVNRGLDLDRNGTVTKREATGNIRRLYQLGMAEENYG